MLLANTISPRVTKSFFMSLNVCGSVETSLNSLFPFFFGADSHCLLNGCDENLSIPNLARLGRFDNGIDGCLDPAVGEDHFDLNLREEIDRVFAATINLSMTLL